MKGNESLNQYFTPVWAAEQIVEHYYPGLSSKDMVADIGCGDGRFLQAIPDQVPAYGIEIDPNMAHQARVNTGREVFEQNLMEVDFPHKPTLLIGNPPFEMEVVKNVLDQAFEAMEYGGKAGFILPVYFFQTADTVLDISKQWSIKHDLMPRNMFQAMQKPIMFAQFLKEKQAILSGMFLYQETSDILSLKKRYRLKFMGNKSSTHLWGEVVEKALAQLGGKAALKDIYQEIEGKRPTKTNHWKAQIRKVLRQNFQHDGNAIYSLELQ